MTNILGICNLSDSGAALINETGIINAVNEERLNRVKLYGGIPAKSVEYASKDKIKIDAVALAGQTSGLPDLKEYIKNLLKSSPTYYIKIIGRFKHVLKSRLIRSRELKRFAKKKFPKAEIFQFDHHLAHASSAHWTSGQDKNLVVTMDAWGDRLSNGAYLAKESIEMIHCTPELYSAGYFYGRITTALGFKYHRHEGKITGLAAYGKVNEKLLQIMSKMIRFNKKIMSFTSNIGRYYIPSGVEPGLERVFKIYKKEDVAATAQFHLERIVGEYITSLLDENGSSSLALAGGVFANVKLNQTIKNISGVKNIFIHPHMGDGGLGMGAALQSFNSNFGKMKISLKNVYFGPRYTNNQIKKELLKHKLDFKLNNNIEYEIAELLAKGKVVARFDGRMEYGPRALGNRTILFQTTDKSVNDWLNKNLQRTEFMPFAPATLSGFTSKCYKDYKKGEYAARFMTITFDSTEWMKDNSPGVVHLDGTARPQLVDKEINPSYFKIIDEYRKITGIPSLINTSFNMHEEPIVCSPFDAIRAFKLGHLDYLAIGSFLVKGNYRK